MLTSAHWDKLVRSIVNGKCVLVLGHDIEAPDPPLTTQLARHLAGLLKTVRTEDPDDLARTAQAFVSQEEFRDRDEDLVPEAKQFIEKFARPLPVHAMLARLPIPLVLTSSLDGRMAKALADAGRDPTIEHFNFREKRNIQVQGSRQSPLVYHLQGHVRDASSMVLTEVDQLEFLVRVIDWGLPDCVAQHFKAERRCFLLLGFRANDWAQRLLLHALRREAYNPAVYACERLEGRGPRGLVYYKEKEASPRVFEMEDTAILPELLRRLEEHQPAEVTSEATTAPGDGPKVFLSYASEDRDRVLELHDRLKALGLRPWMDKMGLHGGVDFDKTILPELVGADYCLVVHTKALLAKSETTSYVNKEVREALDRAKQAPLGGRFLIPLRLENVPLRADVAHLHWEDLSDAAAFDASIEKLAKDLKRDHARRLRGVVAGG